LIQTNSLAELLVRTGLVHLPQIEQVLHEQQRWGGRLLNLLVERGLVREEQVIELFHRELRIPAVGIERLRQIPMEVLKLLPSSVCEKYDLLPIACDFHNKRVMIATSDPSDAQAIQSVREILKMHIDLQVTTTSAIHWAIRVYFYGDHSHNPLTSPVDLAAIPASSHHANSQAIVNQNYHSHYTHGTAEIPPSLTDSDGRFYSGHAPLSHTQGLAHHIPPLAPPTQSNRSTFDHAIAGNNQLLYNVSHAQWDVTPSPHISSNHPLPDLAHSRHAQVAVKNQPIEDQRLQSLLRELQNLRKDFLQFQESQKRELFELQEFVRNRFQEHRLLMRGLFDLLVERNILKKEEIVAMVNQVSQQNPIAKK
jgi:hypothetical protein